MKKRTRGNRVEALRKASTFLFGITCDDDTTRKEVDPMITATRWAADEIEWQTERIFELEAELRKKKTQIKTLQGKLGKSAAEKERQRFRDFRANVRERMQRLDALLAEALERTERHE